MGTSGATEKASGKARRVGSSNEPPSAPLLETGRGQPGQFGEGGAKANATGPLAKMDDARHVAIAERSVKAARRHHDALLALPLEGDAATPDDDSFTWDPDSPVVRSPSEQSAIERELDHFIARYKAEFGNIHGKECCTLTSLREAPVLSDEAAFSVSEVEKARHNLRARAMEIQEQYLGGSTK